VGQYNRGTAIPGSKYKKPLPLSIQVTFPVEHFTWQDGKDKTITVECGGIKTVKDLKGMVWTHEAAPPNLPDASGYHFYYFGETGEPVEIVQEQQPLYTLHFPFSCPLLTLYYFI
jgi:hypothetical protein